MQNATLVAPYFLKDALYIALIENFVIILICSTEKKYVSALYSVKQGNLYYEAVSCRTRYECYSAKQGPFYCEVVT